MLDLIDNLTPGGATNFCTISLMHYGVSESFMPLVDLTFFLVAGFKEAYTVFNNSIAAELTAGCNRVILFMTDGEASGTQ